MLRENKQVPAAMFRVARAGCQCDKELWFTDEKSESLVGKIACTHLVTIMGIKIKSCPSGLAL